MATAPKVERADLAAVGVFVAARIVVIGVLGVRMDLQFLTFAPHLPDIGLLQHDLLRTLLYTHTQPPLFAGFVGLLLKLSPFPDGITFQVAYLALGLVLAVTLRRLFAMLGLGPTAVLVALALVFTNPALVAIEFVASYDEPTIVLLALLALKAGRYVGRGATRDLGWASGLAAAAVLTRTVFHPVWFVLVIVGLVAMRRPAGDLRRVAAVVAIPAIVILACIAKNQVLYGQATLTTFAGPSLSKIAGSAAPPAERRRLIDEGVVSPIFGRPVFWGYDTYASGMPPCTIDHPDIPVLAQPTRPVGGYPNMNYECMLAVYRQQGADASAYIRHDPRRFVAAQLGGAQMFFEPSLPIIFTSNEAHLHRLDGAYAWTLFPRVRLQPITSTEFGQLRVLAHGGIDLVPTILILDLAAIGLGLWKATTLVRRRRRTGGSARREALGAWAAVGFTCGWVTVVGSLLEINENARYRQLIEPFLLATLVYLVQEGVRRLRPAVSGRPDQADDDDQRRTSMSSPMSSTGDELVSDPDDTTSAPVDA